MTLVSKKFTITHVELRSTEPTPEVHRRLLASVPRLNPRIAATLRGGDDQAIEKLRANGPPLWLFECREMGSMLAADGRARILYQYEIGNPLTAERMSFFRPGTALYAPLRVVLFGEAGSSVFAYDRPSELFGQFDDERVAAIGRDLDRDLESVLSNVLRDEYVF